MEDFATNDTDSTYANRAGGGEGYDDEIARYTCRMEGDLKRAAASRCMDCAVRGREGGRGDTAANTQKKKLREIMPAYAHMTNHCACYRA